MSKNFLLILVSIIVVLGGVFAVTNNKTASPSNSNQPTNHIEGSGKKGVTLIEYGDYQCSACYSYYPIVKEVVAKYKDDIYFQFRNLPLSQVHKNAFGSARAAEAAGLQDKYFEMNGLLYENQDPSGQTGWVVSNTPLNIFSGYAKQLGLNMDKFVQDYASQEVNNAINADVTEFDKTKNEHATPTFFLDGKKIENSNLTNPSTRLPSLEAFSKLIDAEIKAKQTSQ